MFRKYLESGEVLMVKRLLAVGHNPFGKMEHDRSYLHFAVIKGGCEMVEILLEAQIDPNGLDDFHRTPLFYAVINDNVKMVKLLLKWGANPRFQMDGKETVFQFTSNPVIYNLFS